MKSCIISFSIILLLSIFFFNSLNIANADHLYSVSDTINFVNPYPSGVTINFLNNDVYVKLFDSSSISIINGDTNKITDVISLPASVHPDDIAYNMVNGVGYLYVIDRSSSPHSLKVIDISTKQIVANIPILANANDVAVNRANSKVYVTADDGVTGTNDS